MTRSHLNWPSLQRPIRRLLAALLLAALVYSAPLPASLAAGGTSLRFYGAGEAELDRVQIPLGPLSGGQISASHPVNVGGDFTVEFWMRAAAAENTAPTCGNGWYYGNIIIDRDVDGAGDYGDYGVALCDGRIAFGVSAGDDDRQLIGDVGVADDQWHHIAVTRRDGGELAIYVDGQPAGATAGPAGRVDYRAARETSQPNSDPYLVLGAEKHLYPGSYHYAGFLDDLRISNLARYSGAFSRPAAPHPADEFTVALYRFDEGAGTTAADSSGAAGGPSDGALIVAGAPASPAWSSDTPFSSGAPTPAPEPSATSAPPGSTESAPTAANATVEALTPTPATPAVESSPTRAAVATLQLVATDVPAATAVATAAAEPTAAPPTTAAPQPAGGAAPAGPAVPAPPLEDSPPPASGAGAFLSAWLVAAAMLAAAVAALLRWRSRG